MNAKSEYRSWAWYKAHCAAMLETDAGRVPASVESARRAIHCRAIELRSANSPENHELDRAMYFLGLLLRCKEADLQLHFQSRGHHLSV